VECSQEGVFKNVLIKYEIVLQQIRKRIHFSVLLKVTMVLKMY